MAEPVNLFAREGQVTDDDRDALIDAIKSAYPNRDFLYLRLARKMALDVGEDVISLQNPGTIIVTAIVKAARAQGKTLELLGVVWSDVPGNPALRALADRFLPDQAGVLAKFAPAAAAPPPPAARPSLERLVDKRSRLLNLQAFAAGLARLSGALCLVRVGGSLGTGFLVGRSAVLTNYHVVKDALRDGRAAAPLGCTFDHDAPGQPELVVPGADDWLIDASPYAESDLSGTGEPGPGELDYALVRLAHEVEPGRRPLGWPAAPPIVAQRDFLVIGQHPGGEVQQIAFGEVGDLPGSGLRYRYDVTTEPGSSGSPVLNLDLELVGLHHAAEPVGAPRYNQAVPIARIMQRLRERQVDLATL